MKYGKALFISLLIIGTVLLFQPKNAEAQSPACPFPGCFGGISTPAFTFCTCSGFYWMTFAPLYFYGVPAPVAGALAVPPVVTYSHFATVPTQAMVGTYIPGVQACWMFAVFGCFPLPTYGMVLPFTGVSLPGAR